MEDRLNDKRPRPQLPGRRPGEVKHDVRHGVSGVGEEVETIEPGLMTEQGQDTGAAETETPQILGNNVVTTTEHRSPL